MKALVLELKENRAAVLDDCGIVHAVIDKGYAIGQVLNITEFELKRDEAGAGNKGASSAGKTKAGLLRRAAGEISVFTRVAAAILAVVIVGGGVTAYAAPVSTVTVEGATSVEYKLNIFDRVVDVSIPDDTADVDSSELSREVKGMKITDAIDATAQNYGDKLFDNGIDGKETELTVRVGGLKQSNTGLSDKLDKKVVEIKNKTPDSKKSGTATEAATEITDQAVLSNEARTVNTDYTFEDSHSDDSDQDSEHDSNDDSNEGGASNTNKPAAKNKKTSSAKSDETAATEQSQTETGAAEAQTAEAKKEEVKASEQKPAETKAEEKSSETRHEESKPADKKPEEEKPKEEKPREEKPKEEKREEPASGETEPKEAGNTNEEKPETPSEEIGHEEGQGQASDHPGEEQQIELVDDVSGEAQAVESESVEGQDSSSDSDCAEDSGSSEEEEGGSASDCSDSEEPEDIE